MLIPLPEGGAIIDNPGMRELQLWASEDALDDVFHEITALAQQCRYGDCAHTGEPGCAVREALDSGELDPSRWESYRKLGAELRYEMLSRTCARIAQKEWKSIHKDRHHPKYRR
jgi:ribosome biogenesis GTPase